MAKEADAHAAEDKEKKEEIESRNQLDGMVYSIEKMLREHGDKISGGERQDVENALADAKKALEGSDKGDGHGAREADGSFAQAGRADVQGHGDAGRRRTARAASRTWSGSGSRRRARSKQEGVIDAEYVDVEDKK